MMASNNRKIKIGLCGASGKMGQAISQRINSLDSPYIITSEFSGSNKLSDLKEFCENSDIIIDFSSPDILEPLLDNSIEYNSKLVIGTTNLKQQHFAALNKAGNSVAVLYSANMSIGANLIAIIAAKTASMLDHNYDIEILDKHHRYKKDAPSGTAIMLGKAVAKARNISFEASVIFDRHANGLRTPDEIGISSIRGGGIYGEHEVFFIGNDEVISVKHQCLNRNALADGAIAAASWIIDKQPGLYSMADVLCQKAYNSNLK